MEGSWPWSLLWGHPYTYLLVARRPGVTKYRKIFFLLQNKLERKQPREFISLTWFWLFSFEILWYSSHVWKMKREKEYFIFYNWWKMVDFEWKFSCEGEALWDNCPLWDDLLGYCSLFWQWSTQRGWTRKCSFLCCFSRETCVSCSPNTVLPYWMVLFLKKSKELILKANII